MGFQCVQGQLVIRIFNYYRVFQRSRPNEAIIWTIVAFFCCIGAILGQYDRSKMFSKDVLFGDKATPAGTSR